MALEWCEPCKDRGRLSLARHHVAGTPMCDGCFGGKPSGGVSTELAAEILKEKRKDTTMAVDKEAMQRDRDSGMRVEEIAAKHGCDRSLVYAYTRATGGDARARKIKKTIPAKSAAKSSNGSGAMTAMEELCEALWARLPLEKKAELLKQLSQKLQ